MFSSGLLQSILKKSLAISLLLIVGSTNHLTTVYLPLVLSDNVQTDHREMRGAWATPWSINTQEKVDQVLERLEAGRLNTVFACVFYEGRSLYPSTLAKTHEMVEPGFDPLAYLVNEAHRRNIEVHAWFVAGKASDSGESPLLAEHPDWRLIGPDGGSIEWLNFSHPDVRQFFDGLASEIMERYGIDGVHLDYIRYPDPEWGFDSYSMEVFQEEYGLDADQIRHAQLPAYGMFTGNPLTNPSTANVLATFANGYPAVTLNPYGMGEAVLFNWQANTRNVALSSEILKRSLQRLLQPGGDVFILRSETNATEYGYKGLNQANAWLEYLGWDPQEVGETELINLSPDSVLVLPGIYLITQNTAAQMGDFVTQGGGLIIIDGPTLSIDLPEIQAITGMQSRGNYFKEQTIMTANNDHELIPTSQQEVDLALFQSWDETWKEFRRNGVTLTVQELHQRVESTSPELKLSTVIPTDPDTALQISMQDWPAWLQGVYTDLLIPLIYVDQIEKLETKLDAWQPALSGDVPIAFGLISYTGGDNVKVPKPTEQLITEINMLRQAGIYDFVIFDLDSLSDEQLAGLAETAQITAFP